MSSVLFLSFYIYFSIFLNCFQNLIVPGNSSSLALLQLESQHGLASNSLHHLMEQLQRRSSYVNFFHPVNSNNNNRKPTMAKLKPLTDKDWTQELETFCGHKLDKVRFIFSLPFFSETHIQKRNYMPYAIVYHG
jgi:hypothetical protein